METYPFKNIADLECTGCINLDYENRIVLSQPRAGIRINDASKDMGTDAFVQVGTVVHKTCRLKFHYIR